MGFTMPHITTLVAIGSIGIALLFQIIGVAAPGWVVITGDNLKAYVGLWKRCVSGPDSGCAEYPASEFPDYLHAVRAFGLMGVIIMAASLASGLLIVFVSNQRQLLSLVAPVTSGLGALFSLIEWAVFVGKSLDGWREYLGYSFALTVVATILCLVATGLFVVSRGHNSVS